MKRDKKYFNPRSPSGLRLRQPGIGSSDMIFQSTQPEWAATEMRPEGKRLLEISIHAARVGCDGASALPSALFRYFNPRSPSGLRRAKH